MKIRSFLKLLDGVAALLSPFAVPLYVIAAIMLIVEWAEHPALVRTLSERGIVTTAEISYLSPNGFASLDFTSPDGTSIHLIIDDRYYSDQTWQTLEEGTTTLIRYDPQNRVSAVFEEHWTEVAGNRQRITELLLILGICLLILAIRPDILYAGYEADWGALYRRELNQAPPQERS